MASGADLAIKTGAAASQAGSAAINVAARTVTMGAGPFAPDNVALYNSVQAGDEVKVDNSQYLARQTSHRHNVPTPDMYGWNQFRRPDGTPMYPQRAGPIGAAGGTGALNNGLLKGKMILMQSLMDIDAFPWQADWYRKKAEEALGTKYVGDNFRLWFTDHAQHNEPVGGATKAWVEKGVRPPASTSYRVADAQGGGTAESRGAQGHPARG
jgi:hypothetical protein